MKTQSYVLPHYLIVMIAHCLSFLSYRHCVMKIFSQCISYSLLSAHSFLLKYHWFKEWNFFYKPLRANKAKRLIKHNKSFLNSATTIAQRLYQQYQRLLDTVRMLLWNIQTVQYIPKMHDSMTVYHQCRLFGYKNSNVSHILSIWDLKMWPQAVSGAWTMQW